MNRKSYLILQLTLGLILAIALNGFSVEPDSIVNQTWVPDLGNGKYKNPIIHADYSDPDVVQVEQDYYMTASSFNCVPGLPVLHSTDLVNWELINYALPKLVPEEHFAKPQHGKGVWAPSIRFYNGLYYIYWGDPDFGIYMVKTTNPEGTWSEPHLVQAGKGLIDPCPLWDDDGNAYLVHAFAGSRSGLKSILLVHRMASDGTKLLDQGVLVFDGHENHQTVEGPKFYKKDGYYYIFAPAGGVPTGWQLALRSKSVWGPYQEKIVLHQGNTDINGPHQGGWVSTPDGKQDWFIHFQDKEAYGRVVHLQPVQWKAGWPEMGIDNNNDGIGEPVSEYTKPAIGGNHQLSTPPASDEFNTQNLGLQWQWHANPAIGYGFPSGNLGYLRLNAKPKPEGYQNLWDVPNLLLQKFTAEEFAATAKVNFYPMLEGDKLGLLVMGLNYAYLALENKNGKMVLQQVECNGAENGNPEKINVSIPVNTSEIYFRVRVEEQAKCQFYFSENGIDFKPIGTTFQALPGKWIGAKIGFFSTSEEKTNNSGYANIDWFRIE